MKQISLIASLLLALLIQGCTTKTSDTLSYNLGIEGTEINDTANFNSDTMVVDESPFLIIDFDYIEKWQTTTKNKEIADVDMYKLNTFTRLKNGQDQFSYYILEKLQWGESFNSFLIYEDYESESAVWLANYDKDQNLIDASEIFYDNAEGAWSTTAKLYIQERMMELTEYNAYATPETSSKKIKIASTGKIEK